jgi:hypothetical protein
VTRYARLINEYFAGAGSSREHVLAYHDAMEITEVYKLWTPWVDKFPRLKEKITEAMTSGPTVQDDETPSDSGPRNYAFNYFVAGRLLAAGCDVICVDGINRTNESGHWFGDVTFRNDGRILDIQCKRPHFADTIQKNVHRAEKQILNVSPGIGIIAIDASVFIRPQGSLLTASSGNGAADKLSSLIQPHAESVADKMRTPRVAGVLWFGRLPSMVSEPSRIVKATGGRYDLAKPYSTGEVAVGLNHYSPIAPVLYDVSDRLRTWFQSSWN